MVKPGKKKVVQEEEESSVVEEQSSIEEDEDDLESLLGENNFSEGEEDVDEAEEERRQQLEDERVKKVAEDLRGLRNEGIEQGSWGVYIGQLTRFYAFSVAEKKPWVNEAFREKFWPDLPDVLGKKLRKAEAARKQAFCEEIVRPTDQTMQPFIFSLLSPEDIVAYAGELKTSKGKNKGKMASRETLGLFRASIMWVMGLYDYYPLPEFKQKLSKYYRSLNKRVAKAKARGDLPLKKGKDALPYALLVDLCQLLIMCDDPSSRFLLLYLLLCWNLMCRASNTANILLEHISWSNDALLIQFAHMKNDQTGERSYGRHCYANSVHPSVNLLMAFALYFLEFPIVAGQTHLFPGSNVEAKYNAALRAFLSTEAATALLHKHGKTVDDIASHSARKGASTFCLSTLLCGPGYNAVCIRCGWIQGGMMDTYVFFDVASDQFTGICTTFIDVFELGYLRDIY